MNKNLFILLVICCYPIWLYGSQWIGVLPLSNQRTTSADDWLGFYAQARIQAFLKTNSNWQFHSPSALRLWYHKNKSVLVKPIPINQHTTVIISGSYQKVVDLVVMNINIIKFEHISGEIVTEDFDVEFTVGELENVVDQLALKLGQWVSQDLKFYARPKFPDYKKSSHQKLMMLHQIMFTEKDIPTSDLLFPLLNDKTLIHRPDVLATIIEGMIILSRSHEKDRTFLENRVDTHLREGLRQHQNNSRLLALFAENLLFMGKDKKLVNQAAKTAILADNNNALAYLMFSMSTPIANADRSESLLYMKEINPWLWPKSKADEVQFQKGILNQQMLSHK